MSDWEDAKDLATAVTMLGAAGILFAMNLSMGDVSTARMVSRATDVVRIIAVPSFGLIFLLWLLLKTEPLIDALAEW